MAQRTDDSRLWRGFFCTLIGGIGWGFSGACGQYLFSYQNVTPEWLTVTRMLIAGVLLCAFYVPRHWVKVKTLLSSSQAIFWLVLYSITGLMMSQMGYLQAVSYTNSGTATMLLYVNPVFILTWVCLIQKRLPNAREILAIFCALAGTFFMATHADLSELVISPQGLAWGLAGALAIAVYTILPAQCLSSFPTPVLMAVGMIVGGLITGYAVDQKARQAPWFSKGKDSAESPDSCIISSL